MPDRDHTHNASSATPHNSLETELVSSTSPHPSSVPILCVENAEKGDKECFNPSCDRDRAPNQGEEPEEQFYSLAAYDHSSGEEEVAETKAPPTHKVQNLISKSAPSIASLSTEQAPPPSISDYVIIDSIAPPPIDDSSTSDVPLSGGHGESGPPPERVVTTPSTPVATPPVRKHKKSHSMSGVVLESLGGGRGGEQEGRLDAHSHASSIMSIDSSKPTTATTSSYTSSEEDEEDEEEEGSAFETANEADLKSKSGASIDDAAFVSLQSSLPFTPYLEGRGQNVRIGEDVNDGVIEEEEKRKRSIAQERRYSLNVVTNIDDYSASSDDDGSHAQRRSNRSPNSATPTHQLTEVLSNRTSEGEENMTLSDIEVQVGSLEEDKMPQKMSGGNKATTPTAVGNRSPVPRPSGKSSFTQSMPSPLVPRSSAPVLHDPKHTIKLLKALTQEAPPTSAPYPIKKSRSETLPVVPLPSDFPSFGPAHLTGTHTNVSRNASSASDSAVTYQASQRTGVSGASSLDFVKPPEGRSSARSSSRTSSPRVPESTTPLPPSPLYISKSPRSSPRPSLMKELCHSPTLRTPTPSITSPLEKKAKSVDNLLAGDELIESEREQARPSVKFQREVTEEDEEEFRSGQRKDIQSYLGIMDPVSDSREPSKNKGISKLLRRNSKKDKRSTNKKTDSLTSLDSVFLNNGQQQQQQSLSQDDKNGTTSGNGGGRTRMTSSFQAVTSSPGAGHSPIFRKPRSHTIHGDLNLSASNDLKVTPLDTKGTGPEEEVQPPSPRGKSDGSVTTETPELGDDASLSVNIDDHPLLVEDDDTEVSWYQTIDRRLRRSINKHEKGRQGAIFDFVRTERHIHKVVLILKLVFRDKLSSELGMSEEILNHLFPSLDQLLIVTEDFHKKLESKQRSSSMMISDISDILMEQFTGFYGKRMKEAYTSFICRQSEALELYRDLEKKRAKFARLMTLLYAKKQCERRKLPDFYLLLTQRVAKYVEMMKKLVKETEALKLDHIDRLKKADKALQELVASIDLGVLKYENRRKLEDIQSRLDLQVWAGLYNGCGFPRHTVHVN